MVDDQCVAVSDDCKDFDREDGSCTECYWGWELEEGVCYDPAAEEEGDGDDGTWHSHDDPNCKIPGDDACQECYSYWYPSEEDGYCTEVSSQCNGYDKTNGHCEGCWSGWYLNSDGACRDYPEE